MTDNSTRTAGKAARHLTTVTPSQVTAMRAADESGHLSALVTAVLACAAHDSADVQEHAALTVASFWSGGGAADTLHAARAAVRAARRTVALASEAADWDLYGDLTEDITTDWQSADLHSTLSHWGTAPADMCAVTTPADVVDHAVTTVPGPRAVTLSRMVADYRAHDADACERCHDGAGRRVSLTGITAHAEGWDGTDSRYHAARRHAVAALAAVDADRVLSELDGAPLAGRPRHSRATGGDRTPRTADHVTPGGAPDITLPETTVTRETMERAPMDVWQGTDVFALESRLMRLTPRAGWTDENGYPGWLGYGAVSREIEALECALMAARARARETRPAPVVRRSVVTLAPRTVTRPAMAPVDVVTVRAADGTVITRDLTDAETVALATAGERTAPARHAGEEYGTTTAPYAPATADPFGRVEGTSWVETGKGATPVVSPEARVKSHKPVVSPRKKAPANCASVPARLS